MLIKGFISPVRAAMLKLARPRIGRLAIPNDIGGGPDERSL